VTAATLKRWGGEKDLKGGIKWSVEDRSKSNQKKAVFRARIQGFKSEEEMIFITDEWI